jgi:hypothetical protein
MPDELTYACQGPRIEYRFRGLLIFGGAPERAFIPVITRMRRDLGCTRPFDGTFQKAMALWRARREVKE